MAQEPPTINHFIGQEQVVKRFRVAMEAAWNDGTRLPDMLFCGPPGVGKTVLAHLGSIPSTSPQVCPLVPWR